ncbi:maestro heat-like repeat-containing protein family member 1 isoform X4 [Amphibalanus amphitrite]|uniref:maestro heat-like repeat-containing protein family member 1 isoform X4 n=1 Tax=Amphibalanus amphitrite TaxID=1232801 RepID=UPI001C913ADC|nr:maestro heat-like repeat-containing protein family member 1 isoform X4 [Amphibalanus amphitrite]
MEASGEQQPPLLQDPPTGESPPPAEPAVQMSEEGLGNSRTAHEHAGDPGEPANHREAGNEAGPGAVDEEGTDALTVVGAAAGPRAVIGDRSDRLSKQYLQRSTELRGLLTSLLDAASDVQDEVRASVSTAIFTLGRSKPYDVLLTVFNYLTADRPKGFMQRICILQAVEEICRDVGAELDDHEVMEIAPLIVNEMVSSKEVIPQIQQPCSEALVGLGQNHCFQVMEILTTKLETSQLPHFYTLQTMGSLATSNVYTMVPFLKGILGPMQPMLNMVKQDNLKWAFAFVIARFCECITEYLANIDKAPDPLVKKEFYSTEINSAFDILFNSWLTSKDSKVRLQVAESIGQMAHIMDTDKLSESLTKLLPALLQLYKRHSEPYPVTCALAMVLDASLITGKHVLELHMEAMLTALFQQVCAVPDYTLPLTVKNHYEVLRCCDTLAKCSPDPVVSFYLNRLGHSSDRVRTGSLTVLKHLINASEFELAQKVPDIEGGLRLLLMDPSNKVKKALTQVIMALAHRGFLTQQDGAVFVEFIVRQCCLPDEPPARRPAEADVTAESLRSMCENVLHLLSTTVDQMLPLLWPHLLEYLTPEYAGALPTVIKCAAQLAGRARKMDPEPDIYANNPNLHQPATLLSYLMVWLGCPEPGSRGHHTLQLMEGVVNQINTGLAELWDLRLPELTDKLNENYDGRQRREWEQSVLSFLRESLVAVDNQEWVDQVGAAMAGHLSSTLYAERPRERAFLMRCMAACVCRQQHKKLVCAHIDSIFASVRHAEPCERQGCAQALGLISSVHLDPVLAKLDQVARAELSKKPTGLLGFMKDTKGEAAQERMRATVILCYGQVALMAPQHLLLERFEVPVFRDLQTFLPNCKTAEVRRAIVETSGELARALHPDRLKERYRFRGRDQLLQFILTALRTEHELEVVHQILASARALVSLDPALTTEDRTGLMKTVFEAVYPVRRELPQDHESTAQYQIHRKIVSELDRLVCTLLLRDVSPAVLDDLVTSLVPWVTSQAAHERAHSMSTLGMVLQTYLDNVHVGEGLGPVSFCVGGQLLATLVPRCVDPELTIRPIAFDAVHTVLKILSLYEGSQWDMEAMAELREKILNAEEANIKEDMATLSQILSERVSSTQIRSFFETLLPGLLDVHPTSSLGGAVTVTVLLRMRGAEFYEHVPEVLRGLHTKLSEITHPETRQEVLNAVQTLSSHHIVAVTQALLAYPLPYDDHVTDCWRVIGRDSRLSSNILQQFMELVSSSAPYEEQRDPGREQPVRIAMLQPLCAISAMTELFSLPELADACGPDVPQLLSRLLLAQAAYVGVFPPVSGAINKNQPAHSFVPNRSAYKLSPFRIASEALLSFLRCVKLTELAEVLTSHCEQPHEDLNRYSDFVIDLSSALVTHSAHLMAPMVKCLAPDLSSMYEAQRIAAVAFYGELVHHRCAGNLSLIETVLTSLSSRLIDSSPVVRRLCLLGLGHISHLDHPGGFGVDYTHLIGQFAQPVMSALLGGLDDREEAGDGIPLQAMTALSGVLKVVSSEQVQHTLIPITIRIRVYFESESVALRSTSLGLFGACSAFCQGGLHDQYMEQAHNNLVSLLIHLNDPEPSVVLACKSSLRQVGPLLDAKGINAMLQKHLIDEGKLQYANFVSDLSKLMVEELEPKLHMYIMSLLAHFRSGWTELKGTAALLVAFLLCNLPAEHRSNVKVQPVCSGLKKLLQDSDWHVRSQAAKAISLLHDY